MAMLNVATLPPLGSVLTSGSEPKFPINNTLFNDAMILLSFEIVNNDFQFFPFLGLAQ